MPYKIVILLNVTVNYLLLLSAAGLCGQMPGWPRMILAACMGGVYAGACLAPGFSFLGSLLWRLVSLAVMGLLAFGMERPRSFAVIGVLGLALDGVVSDTGGPGMLLCAFLLYLLCMLVRGRGTGALVPVELSYGAKQIKLNALRDTGNLLHDPISGTPVLVIGAEAAQKLTGLTAQQLKAPLETMGTIPGLRLIPYKAVGSSGFLLALKLDNVRIGTWRGSRLVAFAPEGLGGNGKYEALTGGIA